MYRRATGVAHSDDRGLLHARSNGATRRVLPARAARGWQTGTGHARQAHAASVKAFGARAGLTGARAGLTGGTASTLANCLIGRAQWNEAAGLLDSIDVKATTQLAGDPDWFAGVELARAEIALGRHDAAEARRRLSLAEPVFAKPAAEEYQKKTVARLRAALGAASH